MFIYIVSVYLLFIMYLVVLVSKDNVCLCSVLCSVFIRLITFSYFLFGES